MSQPEFQKVYDSVQAVLSSDRDGVVKQVLEAIVKLERSRPPDFPLNGAWEWFSVHGDSRTLNALVTRRILDISYKSNKSTYFKAVDLGAIEKALQDYELFTQPPLEAMEIPADLFSIVIGHDEKKDILRRSITSDQTTHALLHGSVASAKTMFLEELGRLPQSMFILGSSLTRAGLYEALFNDKPRYLILDEIDKVAGTENLTCLLSLMERGMISETKWRRHRKLRLKCSVYASANYVERLPPELLSRFLLLRFRDYTPQEYLDVASYVLREREGASEEIAIYVADKVLSTLGSKDVRDSVKVMRLLKDKTKEEVDTIVEVLRKQK